MEKKKRAAVSNGINANTNRIITRSLMCKSQPIEGVVVVAGGAAAAITAIEKCWKAEKVLCVSMKWIRLSYEPGVFDVH